MTQNLTNAVVVPNPDISELLKIEKLITKKSTRKIFRLIVETYRNNSDKDGWIQITQGDIASSLDISRTTVVHGCRELTLLGLIEAKVENNGNWNGLYYKPCGLSVKSVNDRGATTVDISEKSFIYLIQNTVTGNVKIGLSFNPLKRLDCLQRATDCELKLLKVIAGNARLERRLHLKFEEFQVRNEWFSFAEEISAYFGCSEDLV